MTEKINIRELALEVLLEISRKEQKSSGLIHQVLEKYRYLPRQERAFFTRICQGTLEYRPAAGLYSGRLLQSAGEKNEAGDPGDPADGRLSAEIYGRHPGFRRGERGGEAGGPERAGTLKGLRQRSPASRRQKTPGDLLARAGGPGAVPVRQICHAGISGKKVALRAGHGDHGNHAPDLSAGRRP